MKIHTCAQLSEEWWALHRNRVTGSSMNKILTPAKRQPSAQQKGLICAMIGQTLSPYPMGDGDGYVSKAMQEGMRREPEARAWYALEMGVDVTRVGFLESDCGRFGVSPDAIMPTLQGGLELKNPTPEVHAEYLIDGVLPLEYMGQCHGSLIVTGYDWWDFVSYCHGFEPFRIRVVPDDYTAALKAELERFWVRYLEALAKVRSR